MDDESRAPTHAAIKDIRRGLSKSENATVPVTPPSRFISSNYSTPGSTYGKEEDAIIVELNARSLCAGIEGESSPQCRIAFKPDQLRRVDDYRAWLPSYTKKQEDVEKWGDGYELFCNDVKNVDLGLLSDRLERAMREVYNKYLLCDAGSARLVLVIPSLLSHPVLETILQTFFERWPYPSITLLPTPACALVSAGLRSGLVVEIGWEETVVTALYEFREVKVTRSVRGTKALTKEFAEIIRGRLSEKHRFDVEFVEDTLRRTLPYVLSMVNTGKTIHEGAAAQLDIDWPTDSGSATISISTRDLVSMLQKVFLNNNNEEDNDLDDDETPVMRLIYDTLVCLPTDVRAVCISRILFPDAISGLSSFIIGSFQQYLGSQGWNELRGVKVKKRSPLNHSSQVQAEAGSVKHDQVVWQYKESGTAIDEERYLREREKEKEKQTNVHGVVRVVESLGPWAGASLLTSLKIKSFVEIQRERFLNHGLIGASKELDVSVVPQQRASTLGTRSKPAERTSWTLSGWA